MVILVTIQVPPSFVVMIRAPPVVYGASLRIKGHVSVLTSSMNLICGSVDNLFLSVSPQIGSGGIPLECRVWRMLSHAKHLALIGFCHGWLTLMLKH